MKQHTWKVPNCNSEQACMDCKVSVPFSAEFAGDENFAANSKAAPTSTQAFPALALNLGFNLSSILFEAWEEGLHVTSRSLHPGPWFTTWVRLQPPIRPFTKCSCFVNSSHLEVLLHHLKIPNTLASAFSGNLEEDQSLRR